MPRTFKATIALIVTLVILSLLTVINVWQINTTESRVLDLQQQIEDLQSTVESKVRGSGGEAGSAAPTSAETRTAQSNALQEALQDEDNILQAPNKPRVPGKVQQYEGGTLRRAMGSGLKGFNFIVENSVNVQEIWWYVLGPFARRDLENPKEFVPGIAKKITRNEDYTEYTIHLREGIYWHKPNVDLSKEKYQWLDKKRELTAEDCVFSFRMVKNDKVKAGAAQNYFKKLKEVKKVDRYTCKVIWKEKTAQSLPQTLEWYPMPKWLYTRTESGDKIPEDSLGVKFNDHWASRHPVGVGPYKLVSHEPDQQVILERDEDFYGRKPPIKKIKYEIVKKPQKRLLRLKSGSLDFAEIKPPQYRKYIAEGDSDSPFKNGDLEHKVIDEFAYYYIGWNSETPLFNNVKVRRALTHALNRKGIIEHQLHGLGELQTGPYYKDHEANHPDIEPYEYSLQKARKLLSEAGWTDDNGDGVREKTIDGETQKFEFTILVYNKPSARRYISVYKNDLRKIGVNMKPNPVNWPTMQKKMNEKNFDAYTGGWGLSWYVDPYQVWHSSQAEVPRGSNRVGFKNDRADEIIEKLRETLDDDKRIELLREFHKIVHEKQPYTFFYAPKGVYAWQPRLENVQFQKLRPQHLSWPWYIQPDKQQEN